MPNNARHGTKVWRYRSSGGASTRLTLGVPKEDGGDPTGFPILNRTISSRHSFGCAVDCWVRISVEWFKQVGENQTLISTDPMGPVTRVGGSTNWTEINRIIIRQKGMTHWRQVFDFYSTDPRLTDGVGAPLPLNTDVFIEDMYVPDNGLTLLSDEPYLDGDQRGARWEGPAYRSSSVWVLKPDEMPNVVVLPEVIVITADPPPPAPVANFTSSVTNLIVAFTDTSTGSPTAWSWDFGDGSTSTVQNPTHAYASAGTRTVTLTATNTGGSSLVTKSVTVTAPPDPSVIFDSFTRTGPLDGSLFDTGHRWVDGSDGVTTTDGSRLSAAGVAGYWQMIQPSNGAGELSPLNTLDTVTFALDVTAADPATMNLRLEPLWCPGTNSFLALIWPEPGAALLYTGSGSNLTNFGLVSGFPGIDSVTPRRIKIQYTRSTGECVVTVDAVSKTATVPAGSRRDQLMGPGTFRIGLGNNSGQAYGIDNLAYPTTTP